jgi:major histocompatibility complex class I
MINNSCFIAYKGYPKPAVVVQSFNTTTWEAEAGGFLNSRPAWTTE